MILFVLCLITVVAQVASEGRLEGCVRKKFDSVAQSAGSNIKARKVQGFHFVILREQGDSNTRHSVGRNTILCPSHMTHGDSGRYSGGHQRTLSRTNTF